MKFPKRRGQFRNEKLSYSSCTKKKTTLRCAYSEDCPGKGKKKKAPTLQVPCT